MSTQLILDETIRSIVRDEIKKSSQSVFNEEVNAKMDRAINDYMDINCDDKVINYLQNTLDVNDCLNDVISNGSFDISFSG